MWEYDEGFGVISYKDTNNRKGRIVDNKCLQALGLNRVINVYVNSQPVDFDTPPIVNQDRVLIPVRALM